MDLWSLRCLNALLLHPEHTPALEFTFPGPEILFEEQAIFALSGADFCAELNGQPIETGKCISALPGDQLRFRRKTKGVWGYLGFRGELFLPHWLGSFSADPHLKHPPLPNVFQLEEHHTAPKVRLAPEARSTAIPMVPGPFFSEPDDQTFTIDRSANRMGYRLTGPALCTAGYQEQISAPVLRGSVQLLPDGQLIVLMADAQTTGGYPLWAYVPPSGTDALAQLSAGDTFTWDRCTWEDVEIAQKKTESRLLQLQLACQLAWKSIAM